MSATVLVPLDGSPSDERVLAIAPSVAALAGGALHLVSVLDTPLESLSAPAGVLGVAGAVRELRDEMERRLSSVAARLSAETGQGITSEVAEGADVSSVLIGLAAERNADLMVLATRAAGAVGRALRGSVSDRVARESPCPVVLVPPSATSSAGQPVPLDRVLVPLDGSELALSAADHLLGLAGARALEFVLVEVVTSGFAETMAMASHSGWMTEAPVPDAYATLPDIARAREDAGERLGSTAERLRASGVNEVRARVVEERDPAAAILRMAREELVDFIAMSSRGAGGLKRFVLGSVAERVVRESEVPVLVVTHAQAAAG